MAKTYDLSVLFRVIDKATGPIKKVGTALTRLSAPVAKATRGFKKLGEKVSAAGKKMGAVGRDMALKMTLPLTIMGGLAIKSAIDFESAFTGVRKTVDATEKEFTVLKKELMALALEIPLATEEIFGIAEAAGQLGIKQQDILGFTKVMADLGATTNLTSRDAAMQLARFANITEMAAGDMERLGSTIVDLGNNTATTEAEIVEMAMRLAGAGKTVGLTEAQIMSLSASLSSVGIRAEAGGTSFSKVMRLIDKEIGTGTQKMDDFASVSGKSTAQFEKDWEENAGLAILDVIEGLATMGKEGENINIILDELGFKGIRMSDALLRASGSGDKFRKTMALGNKAWIENLALTKEAELRYKTMASRLSMLKNRVMQLAAAYGDVMIPYLDKLIDKLKPVIDWLESLSSINKLTIVGFLGLAAAIAPVLIGLGWMAKGWGVLTKILTSKFGVTGIIITGFFAWIKVIKMVRENWKFLGQEIGIIIKEIMRKWTNMIAGMWLPKFIKKRLGWEEEKEPMGPPRKLFEQATHERALQQGLEKAVNRALEKSQTLITVVVEAAEGTMAKIGPIKSRGNIKPNVATAGFVGVQ